MKGRQMLLNLVLGVAAFFAMLSPAFAWNAEIRTTDSRPGGRVRFLADGDVVEVCDIQADGYAVHVSVYDVTARKHKYSYRIGGNGRCQTLRASLGGKYDLAEGHVFRIRVCLKRGNEALKFCRTKNVANVN